MWQNEIVTEKWQCDVNQHLENEQKLEMGERLLSGLSDAKIEDGSLLVIQMEKETEAQEVCLWVGEFANECMLFTRVYASALP